MTKDENATKSSRNRNRGKEKEKIKPPTKVVIRHLPPTMTEEEFLNHFDPLPKHDFYYFAAADWSLGFGATCRAYITLKNYDDVFMLRDQFDGYVFLDSKGVEYAAIVEFAPFQGLVKNKSRRSDNKVNSIEEEPHYQNFLKKLEEDREAAAKGGECKLEFTLDRKKEEITSTPLLQYLATKKEKRREEKRRQREEEKEKRQQNQQITKIYSGVQDNANGKKPGKDKNTGANKPTNQNAEQQDENKSSRSKRRAERNQRRREQYELRKKEREQRGETEREANKEQNAAWKEKEQTQTVETVTECSDKAIVADNNNPNETAAVPANDDRATQQRKTHDQKPSRKEVKRYSEKREQRVQRERNNSNSNNRDNDKSSVASTSANNSDPSDDKADSGIMESVMNFIRTAANFKEFVPTYLEQLHYRAVMMLEEESERKQNEASEAEKRIRNKDRPSIAIYQPKARLRVSEESDTNSNSNNNNSSNNNNKEPPNASAKPSSSTSAVAPDADTPKAEQNPKKLARYLKRRERRLNKLEKDDEETFPIGHYKREKDDDEPFPIGQYQSPPVKDDDEPFTIGHYQPPPEKDDDELFTIGHWLARENE